MGERTGCLILTDDDHMEEAGKLASTLTESGGVLRWRGDYGEAQTAFQRCCGPCGEKAVAAFGEAVLPALALAIQLEVDRVAVVDACLPGSGSDRRLARFVTANLALCGGTFMWLGSGDIHASRLERRLERLGRVALTIRGEGETPPWTKCEFSVKNAICGFLRSGVHSKLLAENPEMCIIYG